MRPLSLKGHERPITRVRLNREGDVLLSASKDKCICVWYTENGERIGSYEGHAGAIFDIDVTWDTKTLVSAAADSSIKVWDVETGRNLESTTMPSNARSLGLSYSGNLVAVTTTKMMQTAPTLCVVDLRESPPSFIMQNSVSSQSESCTFSNLDNCIVIGCNDGSIHQYDLRQPGDAVNFNHVHHYNVTDLQLSNDQGFIISSSADKTAQLHNARNLESLKKYKSNRPVNSAAISPTRDHIVLGGGEEARTVTQTAASSGQFEAKFYHLVYEEEFARLKGHFGPINTIAFDPTGDIVVSGSEDGYIRIQQLDDDYKQFDFDFQ
ncbi:WD domain, g-beta repeat domain-containing protein [Ditylenchus destructor]|uniref:Eukaryotic translation initiation factor 3 subunit I n=1 Tax=Ditylenchus destructor TaxID=166010 RepID=A0AAD4N3Q0_9BILA|nr:WD domain, g-beta repeat domain-containing protein [Ditylenchus destructor]